MSEMMQSAQRAQSVALAALTLAVGAQGALLVLGFAGVVWGLASSDVMRCLFGVLCLVLGLLALRIASISFDASKGTVRINPHKKQPAVPVRPTTPPVPTVPPAS